MPGIAPNPWMVAPFAALVLAIAFGPLAFPGAWARYYVRIALGLGALVLAYYGLVLQAPERVAQAAREYAGFMALIGSLYVVSGGIHLELKGEATPAGNALFLGAGALLANLLGTTGASLLLIRPWLRRNRSRLGAHHVAFFVFVVANVGGSLTAIGDPPLLLGFLRGVPFFWVAREGFAIWALGVGWLLGIFLLLDARHARRAAPRAQPPHEPWRVEGLANLGFLALILGAVFLKHPPFLRECLMLAAATGSWLTTPARVHRANDCDLEPLREVAVLFAGLFATLLPLLDWLEANAVRFGSPTPALFYWGSGTLSSALDNAPTYLAFLSAALGALTAPGADAERMRELLADPTGARCLLALSIASVFFGANTYLGNGPNLMVKAIAERLGAPVPSFPGYVLRFALPCMLPLLVGVWLLFFRA